MVRLLDIHNRTSTEVEFRTSEIVNKDIVPYIVYDTSTGTTSLSDYIVWRSKSFKTSTGDTKSNFKIDNSNLYPSFAPDLVDYDILQPHLFNVMTLDEYLIFKNTLTRLDLVRKRYPNPGTTIQDTDGVGDGGIVSFDGGWDKKFSIEELFTFIEGSLVEVNIHPPATGVYWNFISEAEDKNPNPYASQNRIPYKITDLIVQGAVIRALISWGILEVDVHFTTSDSGLSITYDRVGYVSSWFDRLLQSFNTQKDFVKYDFVNSFGVGVGTVAYSAMGIVGAAANMISQSGIMPMNTLLGSWQRGNIPL